MARPVILTVNRLGDINVLRVGSHQGQAGLIDGEHAQKIGWTDQPPRFLPDGTARPPWRATSIDGRVIHHGDSKDEVARGLAERLGYTPIDPDLVTPSLI